MSNIAIYPGSFDPFTNGHLDIVKKGANLFDEVHIIIGVNAKKKRTKRTKGRFYCLDTELFMSSLYNLTH